VVLRSLPKGHVAAVASLSAAVDLSKIAGREIELKLKIVGVPSVDKRGIAQKNLHAKPAEYLAKLAKQGAK